MTIIFIVNGTSIYFNEDILMKLYLLYSYRNNKGYIVNGTLTQLMEGFLIKNVCEIVSKRRYNNNTYTVLFSFKLSLVINIKILNQCKSILN